jgi:hypothetical protein
MEEAINHEPRPTHGDLLAKATNDQTGHESSTSRAKREAFQYILIRDHLLTGAPLDKFNAKELYGVKDTSLATTISKLSEAHGWRLEKRRHYDRHGSRYTSYRVMLDKSVKVDTEPPATATVAAPVASSPDCIVVEKVNVIFGKHGPEILIVGEGEPADKPPYKFTRDHLRYLFVNLKLFGEQAKDA